MTTMTRTLPALLATLALLFVMGPSYRPHPLQAHNTPACEKAPEPDGEQGVVIRNESAEDAKSCLTIRTGHGTRVVEVSESVARTCIPDRYEPALYPECAGASLR